MTASGVSWSERSAWSRVGVGSASVAAADRDALGTTARLVVWPPANLHRMVTVVDDELALLDRQASRFRPDSEISLLHARGAGRHLISDGLAEAVGIALAAARWTDGLSDPTVGGALIALGYDRDFAAIGSEACTAPASAPAPGWQSLQISGNVLELPGNVTLDLGATAKGLGADRAARAAYAVVGNGGVLVSLGGDLAVAGDPPAGGWPLLIADEHRQTRATRNLAASSSRPPRRAPHAAQPNQRPAQVSEQAWRGARVSQRGWRGARPGRPAAEADPVTAQQIRLGTGARPTGPTQPAAEADPLTAQQIRLCSGGLATSSVTCRQWLRGGELLHHIIDPRTGRPAGGPWRTVSVAAASCAEANAASTAAIIAGDAAEDWLRAQGLPARLIGHDGSVRLTGGWPAAEGGRVDPPTTSRLLAGSQPERGRS